MLSAQAYSFRQKSKLAISLSWIGGYTNVIALLACNTVVSHVTGNTTWFGQAVAGFDWSGALFLGFVVLAFWVGAMMSALMTETAKRRGVRSKYIAPLVVEAILLGLFAIGVDLLIDGKLGHGRDAIWWIVGAASTAMGLQNATITKISGNIVRTTHLTGVMTDLGLEGVQFLFWWRDKMKSRKLGRLGRLLRVSRRHPTVLRLALLASIFGSFLFGVVAGSWIYNHWPTSAMTAPICFLLFIVGMDWWKPIADTRELDLLGDSEMKALGIIHSLLPKELGIYRIHVGHRAATPDFSGWVDRLPVRWKVVILALSPLVRFTGNAILDLEAALNRLDEDRKKLVLCGVTPPQYRLLDSAGIVDRLGAENVCPDLEFAVAQAVVMLGSREDRETAGLPAI
jgi:uncharacterized membrane protein YoaK (UPF0700 family)